jgi:protein-arginine kinase activator protein McsA
LNDPFELPSLQEIEEMDRQRSQAIESLEISNHSVKCQMCGIAVPIVGKLTRRSDRIAALQKQIKWIEQHYHGLYTLRRHRGNGNIGNNINKDDNVRQLKAELAELLEEGAKYDKLSKLRSLPLYSCRITGFKFVCSRCYDQVYTGTIAKQKR